MSKWNNEKRLIIDTALSLMGKGLVVGKSGNVSLRLTQEGDLDLLAITPTSRPYESLGIEDIQVIDFETEPVEGNLAPSVETMLHIGIYRSRANINAVIHTHSTYACAIATAGLAIPPILEDQVNTLGGDIRVADYAVSGSQELVDNTLKSIEGRHAVILANHGAIGIGRNMREAMIACEMLEKTARIYCACLSLGKVKLLPQDGIEASRAFFDLTRNK
jgi:L-fuculose-phosphate aldolase